MNIGWDYGEAGFGEAQYTLEYSTCTKRNKKSYKT